MAGLYLTNPLEIVSERSAMKQLCSDSVLMVRRQDIISRFRDTTDLGQLLEHPDPRWRTMNVLGKVASTFCEACVHEIFTHLQLLLFDFMKVVISLWLYVCICVG